MKRMNYLILTSMLGLALLGCKKNDDVTALGDIEGEWKLVTIGIEVDDNLVTEITPIGKKATFSMSTFTYSDNGNREGTYEINDDTTALTVSFDAKTLVYPLSVFTESEISFTVKSIDLTATSFTEEEKQVFVLANQNLNLTGRDWESVSSNGQTANVIFNLKK